MDQDAGKISPSNLLDELLHRSRERWLDVELRDAKPLRHARAALVPTLKIV
jgi:hypothetical protein